MGCLSISWLTPCIPYLVLHIWWGWGQGNAQSTLKRNWIYMASNNQLFFPSWFENVLTQCAFFRSPETPWWPIITRPHVTIFIWTISMWKEISILKFIYYYFNYTFGFTGVKYKKRAKFSKIVFSTLTHLGK